jgi:hypothetical protein
MEQKKIEVIRHAQPAGSVERLVGMQHRRLESGQANEGC